LFRHPNPAARGLLALLLQCGHPAAVCALDVTEDAREDPALRLPLPAMAPPGTTDETPAKFSSEAPPPPPFDPVYRPAAPPGPAAPPAER
jgi:hypothetical protein